MISAIWRHQELTTTAPWHKTNRPVVNDSWYLFGNRHRYYGPAYTRSPYNSSGTVSTWFLHGAAIK